MTAAPLWEHVAELRRTLLYSLVAILICTCVAFYFHDDVFKWLTQPLHTSALHHQEMRHERIRNTSAQRHFYTLPTRGSTIEYKSAGIKAIDERTFEIPPGEHLDIQRLIDANTLAVFGPIDGMLIAFKVCFWLGVVIAAPIWVYLLLQFIIPALRPTERRLVVPFLCLSLVFMGTGALLAYKVTIPLANKYLETFNATIGLNFWSLGNYLDYTLFLVLANALAFEIGVILLFLVHFGILTAETMAGKRRHMIVMAFILGALLTPPDILTQFMLAIPLIALYELILLYARFLHKKFT
jgi:sec-independent protein translocase protein TatC